MTAATAPDWCKHPALSPAGQAAIAEGLPQLAAAPPWPPFARDPDYGTRTWQQLANSDPAKLRAVVHAAECWRVLTESGHLTELLAEYAEWMRRRDRRDTAHAISAMCRRWVSDSYAALDRLRYRPHGRLCLIGQGCPECGTAPAARVEANAP